MWDPSTHRAGGFGRHPHRLYREAFSSLFATTLQDQSAAFGFHPLAEAVHS